MARTFIARGTDLFHGTNSETIFEFPESPAWFSSSFSVARTFANFHVQQGEPRVHLFRVRTRIPKLLVIESKEQFDRLMDEMREATGEDTEDPRDLGRFLCKKDLNGWVIPDNYHDGDDIMLCQPRDWLEWRGEEFVEKKKRS